MNKISLPGYKTKCRLTTSGPNALFFLNSSGPDTQHLGKGMAGAEQAFGKADLERLLQTPGLLAEVGLLLFSKDALQTESLCLWFRCSWVHRHFLFPFQNFV